MHRKRSGISGNIANFPRPKLGWEGEKDLNHFKLVEKIYNNEFYISKSEIKELFLHSVLDKMFVTIDRNFSHLFSERRIRLIKDCLEYRYNEINKLLI